MVTPPTQPGHANVHFCFVKGTLQTPGRDNSGFKHLSGAMDSTGCPNFLAKI